eukprot:223888-Pleurochrysis_carterae.AAC.1
MPTIFESVWARTDVFGVWAQDHISITERWRARRRGAVRAHEGLWLCEGRARTRERTGKSTHRVCEGSRDQAPRRA